MTGWTVKDAPEHICPELIIVLSPAVQSATKGLCWESSSPGFLLSLRMTTGYNPSPQLTGKKQYNGTSSKTSRSKSFQFSYFKKTFFTEFLLSVMAKKWFSSQKKEPRKKKWSILKVMGCECEKSGLLYFLFIPREKWHYFIHFFTTAGCIGD